MFIIQLTSDTSSITSRLGTERKGFHQTRGFVQGSDDAFFQQQNLPHLTLAIRQEQLDLAHLTQEQETDHMLGIVFQVVAGIRCPWSCL